MKWVWMCGVALAGGSVAIGAESQDARLRVTQRDLVPQCLNGRTVANGTRAWQLPPGHVSLVFSMRSPSGPGRAATEPGTASITFNAASGHRYEVEVRADPIAFSTRAWRVGEWTPVVRDRTTDRIVSGAPQWGSPPCDAAR